MDQKRIEERRRILEELKPKQVNPSFRYEIKNKIITDSYISYFSVMALHFSQYPIILKG